MADLTMVLQCLYLKDEQLMSTSFHLLFLHSMCNVLLTTCKAAWYIILIVFVRLSDCMYVYLSDDNF